MGTTVIQSRKKQAINHTNKYQIILIWLTVSKTGHHLTTHTFGLTIANFTQVIFYTIPCAFVIKVFSRHHRTEHLDTVQDSNE